MSAIRIMAVFCALAAPFASGCSDSAGLAARVNQAPITVSEVDLLLSKRGIAPAQATAEQRNRALEELIDQALFVQQAYGNDLEEDPRVAQAIKELLARAYLEQQLAQLGEPGNDDIAEYYDEHPELFRERRRYQLQEVAIEAAGESLVELEEKLGTIQTLNDLIDWLNERGIKFEVGASIKSGDDLPMDLLRHLSQAREGQVLKVQNPLGVTVLQVVRIEADPRPLADAQEDIRKFLHNRAIEKLLKETASKLRANAKIERYGAGAA
ncbi:MAG: EpsD family peptidyl-prolyl cis-trans isomerase [Pseudomonadales bacterium]